MHMLISNLFKKRGIRSVNDLSKEEKEKFDEWTAILSEKELTIEDLKMFCNDRLGAIEAKFPEGKNLESLTAQHVVYKSILNALTAPQRERERLEKYLISITK